MLNLTDEFLDANFLGSKEPRFYVKILNDNQTIYLTSHDDVSITDAGAVFFENVLSEVTVASQEITPEKGQSVLSGSSIKFYNQAFTDHLKLLKDSFNDTIYNNKTEVYYGYKGIAADKYTKFPPLYIQTITTDDLSVSLTLQDTARFADIKIFDNMATADVNIETATGNSIRTGTGRLFITDNASFESVQHDANWLDGPNLDVGYVKIQGKSETGVDIIEYLRWNAKGFDATDGYYLDIDKRGCHGSSIIDIDLTDNSFEVIEVAYLNLSIPRMNIALMTGDLYGQVGESIPSHWTAGLDASLVATAEIAGVSNDLNQFFLEFIDPKPVTAKTFLAKQCQSPFNLLQLINQDGEIYLKKFTAQPYNTAGAKVIDYDSIVDKDISIVRDNSSIKNVFSINYNYRPTVQKYRSRFAFIDADSISRNNIQSKSYDINIEGLRNRDTNASIVINSLAEGIRARFSDPSITLSITVPISSGIELELGEIVTLNLQNHPDYGDTDYVNLSAEIQSVAHNLFDGTTALKLFATAGKPTPINIEFGDDVPSIDHTNWTPLTSVLTVGNYTDAAGVLTLTGTSNIPSGKYYYDGDIVTNTGVTVTFNGSTFVDCDAFTLNGTAKWDGRGRGIASDTEVGYFGGEDSAQHGASWSYQYPRAQTGTIRWPKEGTSYGVVSTMEKIPAAKLSVEDFNIKINDSGSIDQDLPTKLYGSPGRGGEDSVSKLTYQYVIFEGPDAVGGGAGLFLLCNDFFADTDARIDTSGSDNAPSNFGVVTTPTPNNKTHRVATGASGFGWPGVFILAYKNRISPDPLINKTHVAKTGNFTSTPAISSSYIYHNQAYWFNTIEGRTTDVTPPTWTGDVRSSGDFIVWPEDPESQIYANIDHGTQESATGNAFKFMRILKKPSYTPNPAEDLVGTAEKPTLTLTEALNTPRSPLGNIATISATVTPAIGDNFFSYAKIEYRLSGEKDWVSAEYGVTTESSFQVTSDGSTYEVRATAIGKDGRDGGSAIESITTKIVKRDTSISTGGEESPDISLTVPKVKSLELVNRIDSGENWDKFKSPNAEFKWKKLSITNSGSITQLNGSPDLHLAGYNVRVSKLDGTILREEITTDAFYTYSFDKNKIDNKGAPVREFKFEVQAVATTGFASPFNGFNVENPAPSAPAGIQANAGFTGVEIKFDLPTDVDFVGCDFYLVEGTGDPFTATPERISGNTVTRENLTTGTEYRYGLRSVDQFGNGSQTTSLAFTTRQIAAADVDDLGPWATIEQADQAFIATYMESGSITEALLSSNSVTNAKLAALSVDAAKLANSAVTTDKIANLAVGNAAIQNLAVTNAKIADVAASKITAGTISASNWIQVGTDSAGVRIDGASATVVSKNSGYTSFFGPLNVPAESANPLIIGANSGANYPFWVDSAGRFKYGLGDNSISFDGSALEFGAGVTIGKNDDVNVTVGTGGDYATLESALIALSKVVPAYKDGGFTATISCLSGYVDTDTHYLKGIDLGWVTIESEAGTLTVSNTGATAWFRGDGGSNLPFFDTNITVTGGGYNFLFLLSEGSNLSFNFSKTITQTATPFDSKPVCLSAESNSFISLQFGTIDGFYTSVSAGDGSHVRVTGTIQNSTNAISAQNATVEARSIDLTNITGIAIYAADCAKVAAEFAQLIGTKPARGIQAERSSIVEAGECVMTGCSNRSVESSTGSRVNVFNGQCRKGASDGSSDLVISNGGIITAVGATGGVSAAANTLTFRGIIFK